MEDSSPSLSLPSPLPRIQGRLGSSSAGGERERGDETSVDAFAGPSEDGLAEPSVDAFAGDAFVENLRTFATSDMPSTRRTSADKGAKEMVAYRNTGVASR